MSKPLDGVIDSNPRTVNTEPSITDEPSINEDVPLLDDAPEPVVVPTTSDIPGLNPAAKPYVPPTDPLPTIVNRTEDVELGNMGATGVVNDDPAPEPIVTAESATNDEVKVLTEAPLAPLVDKFPMTTQRLSCAVVDKVAYRSLTEKINAFQATSLMEIVRKNTNTRFPTNGTKYCYRLDYKNLSLTHADARDNYSDTIVPGYANSYSKQHMNSMSGEEGDMCFYTYSPDQLRRFLDSNRGNKYTYLPVTVYAVDSANGQRHDMLLIFHNSTRLFYWFDCRNREDYLPHSADLPKNAPDVLFTLFGSAINLGFVYEASPSWMVTGALRSYGSVGKFDFLFSTTWCYNLMLALGQYENPTAYMCVLDTLPEEDRFHFMYVTMLNMINADYRQYVPHASQVDLGMGSSVKPVEFQASGVTPAAGGSGRTRTVPQQQARAQPPSPRTKDNGNQLTHRTQHGGATVASRNPSTAPPRARTPSPRSRTPSPRSRTPSPRSRTPSPRTKEDGCVVQ